jgi:hypothetical protein
LRLRFDFAASSWPQTSSIDDQRSQRFFAGFGADFLGEAFDGFADDTFPALEAAAEAGFPFAADDFPAFAGVLTAGLAGVFAGAFAAALTGAFAGALATGFDAVLAAAFDTALLATGGAGLDVLLPLAVATVCAVFFAGPVAGFPLAGVG